MRTRPPEILVGLARADPPLSGRPPSKPIHLAVAVPAAHSPNNPAANLGYTQPPFRDDLDGFFLRVHRQAHSPRRPCCHIHPAANADATGSRMSNFAYGVEAHVDGRNW